ncbi:hypothetical protein U1Q18_036185 [Sarracenia purpurea var. burkii]
MYATFLYLRGTIAPEDDGGDNGDVRNAVSSASPVQVKGRLVGGGVCARGDLVGSDLPCYKMAISSGLMAVHPKIFFHTQNYGKSMPRNYNAIQLISKTYVPRADVQYFLAGDFRSITVTSAGRNHHKLSSGNDFLEEPFWLTLIKDAFWALKSLFIFLLEQPSQLKYIEWPSFQSTVCF